MKVALSARNSPSIWIGELRPGMAEDWGSGSGAINEFHVSATEFSNDVVHIKELLHFEVPILPGDTIEFLKD